MHLIDHWGVIEEVVEWIWLSYQVGEEATASVLLSLDLGLIQGVIIANIKH